ncbi:hypothetical protein IV203_013910 [Nitzschia inconspicua]|uniref:WW domain-containing protein n=1 Tax=Nitzschia inconspicua TaxID=303405 RepID=A0A9K3Q955_9STRA|nr:hypothetical protein IV203_013910 [Nitzschia inconspicua]
MKSFQAALSMLMMLLAAATLDVTSAFQHNTPPVPKSTNQASVTKSSPPAATAAIATAALTAILATTAPALASPTAAQISVDSIPPTTISVQIGDLPVVGSLLSGTYTKVDSKTSAPASVVIKSPTDKVKAIQTLASSGHLEFDIAGKTGLKTHLDVDVAADEPGVATVRVASDLIPKLPFKNAASASIGNKGGRESQWSIVTNLGNGESYYFNTKTGETTFEKPSKI